MTKIVWKTKVQSRNFIADFGSSIRNIIGGRLKAYERMLNDAIKEATDELVAEYPSVKDVRMQITELTSAAICVTVYGVVE